MTADRPDEQLLIEAGELTLVSANRATGEPREDVVKFVYEDGIVYLLARADAGWYGNIQKDRGVVLRVKRRGFRGRATTIDTQPHPRLAGQIAALFKRKYGASALKPETVFPVAIELQF